MRAYSTFEIKRASREERTIEGWASTPSVDLAGDIVDPKGMQTRGHIPFLWQHSHDQPIGAVLSATAEAGGVRFKAKLATVDEPGKLRDRLEEAWGSIKSGLVRGISIGFTGLDYEPMRTGGRRFKSWMLHEISAVTIPCNADCTVATVKAAALAQRRPSRVVRLTPEEMARAGIVSTANRPLSEAMLRAADKMEGEGLPEFVGAQLAALGRAGDDVLTDIRARLARIEQR